MPLLDHFREPLWPRRDWHSFLTGWSTLIAADFNRTLPDDCFAEGGAQYNIDTFYGKDDIVEVSIMQGPKGPKLVGVIELVSPANKDREASRGAFVAKCAGYLQQGIGLIVIDVVTERMANLHDALLNRLDLSAPSWDAELYAVAYHPVQEDVKDAFGAPSRNGKKSLEVWPHELKIGQSLPTLPMCLKCGLVLPLDLEAIYVHTCKESRISMNGK